MQTQDFAKFVASQQDTSQNATDEVQVDWDEIRAEWLKSLDDLYRQVINFLQEFVVSGSIRYRFIEIPLNEENLGSYQARKMEISIGRQHVSLEPIGTLIIGSKGRVDAVGSAGRAHLWLVNENARSAADLISVTVTVGGKGVVPRLPDTVKEPISWAWKIVSRDIRTSFVELDKESFFALLVEIAGA